MADVDERPPFEILEHTADIGLRARGETIEDLFENAAAGLVEILGAGGRDGVEEEIVISAGDSAALLVGFLDELIYLVDARGARISKVDVRSEGPDRVSARVRWTRSSRPLEGTELKAATFHQLSVQESDGGYEATVYFDV